ncbi:hypothetical protein C8Q76DRAFT_694846 [Earliella scabrosa]|nr:hypothetical protein C8Q76DRAFT_694846 [Earliella scabrosa]
MTDRSRLVGLDGLSCPILVTWIVGGPNFKVGRSLGSSSREEAAVEVEEVEEEVEGAEEPLPSRMIPVPSRSVFASAVLSWTNREGLTPLPPSYASIYSTVMSVQRDQSLDVREKRGTNKARVDADDGSAVPWLSMSRVLLAATPSGNHTKCRETCPGRLLEPEWATAT